MKIAFQKNPTSILGKLVCWWTKSPYYHCELVFNSGVSFSAQFFKKTAFNFTYHYPKNWDFIEIPMTKEEEQTIYNWCVSESDCFYDYIGIIFTQFIPLSFQNPWWWFCSENCLAALQQIGRHLDKIPHHYSPDKLYNSLKEVTNETTN